MIVQCLIAFFIINIVTETSLSDQIYNFDWDSFTEPILISRYKLNWTIFDKNSLDNIISDDLNHVYWSNHTYTFRYFDQAIANKYPYFVADYHKVNITREEALSMLQGTTNESLYYSGNILGGKSFSSLIKNIDLYTLINQQLFDKVTAIVWIGSKDVIATPHYDSVNNIYVQLHGQKTFNLKSISAFDSLHMYGRYHPYACQSRFDELKNSSDYDCNICSIKKIIMNSDDAVSNHIIPRSCQYNDTFTVTLNPGDILYIPAYTIHDTKANSASASISLWFDSKVLDVMDDVYSLPLPFEEVWSDIDSFSGIINFCEILVDILDSVMIQVSQQYDTSVNLQTNNNNISFRIVRTLNQRYQEELKAEGERFFLTTVNSPFLEQIHLTKNWFQGKDGLLNKFQDYSYSIAIILIRGIIDFIPSSNDNNLYDNTVSILIIKAADYIEDLFELRSVYSHLNEYRSTNTDILLYWLFKRH